jgi:hypothetical protein
VGYYSSNRVKLFEVDMANNRNVKEEEGEDDIDTHSDGMSAIRSHAEGSGVDTIPDQVEQDHTDEEVDEVGSVEDESEVEVEVGS